MILDAYSQGKIDGAAQAAVPLLIENQGLRAWRDAAEDKLTSNFWDDLLKIGLSIAGGIVVGGIVVALAK